MATPTTETYDALQKAYSYYNKELFGNQLRDCIITLNTDNVTTKGYFRPTCYRKRPGQESDEIALNPAFWACQTVEESLSTLVHEMAHLWQAQHGIKKSRNSYHNKEWAGKMLSLGLQPISFTTGSKGLGQKVTHTIIQGGAFSKATVALLEEGNILSWYYKYAPPGAVKKPAAPPDDDDEGDADEGDADDGPEVRPSKPSRQKYSCPSCGIAVWGARNLRIVCQDCDTALTPAE